MSTNDAGSESSSGDDNATEIAAANALAAAEESGLPGAPPPVLPPVPVTAVSFAYQGGVGSPFTRLKIGDQNVPLQADRQNGFHWYVVVDMTRSLNVVANAVSTDNHTVPADVKRLVGDPRYFVFVIGNNLRGHLVPQGELYKFLKDVGAGRQFAMMEQTVATTGTGTIVVYAYALGATMTVGDLPGFEVYSDNHHVILNMQFLPVKMPDKVVYAPIQHF
jgi:hypothetical protein